MKRPLLLQPIILYAIVASAGDEFVPLAEDGIHDPQSPAFSLLQEPAEALGNLPVDVNGRTDWATTLRNGHIAPRNSLLGNAKMKEVDLDITMKNTASLPHVMFSHRVHTQWLSCSNCHARIFLPQIGGNFITMKSIMEGQYCGVCHGKVAFPALDCDRCHTVTNETPGLR